MPRLGQVLRPLVKLPRDPEACWEWLACKRSDDGLALKQIGGRNVPARRWIWEQLFGPIPDGYVIAQLCGNQSCVNPHHLKRTTLAEAQRLGTSPKLTAADVADIRAAFAALPTNLALRERALKLAPGYEVSANCILDIVRGDTWRSKTKSPQARTPSIRALEPA